MGYSKEEFKRILQSGKKENTFLIATDFQKGKENNGTILGHCFSR